MKRALFTFLAIAAAAGAVSRYYTLRGDLAAQRLAIQAQWSQVDSALERRAELVPRLEEMLAREDNPKAAALSAELAAARAALAFAASPEDKIRANGRLAQALPKLPRIAAGSQRAGRPRQPNHRPHLPSGEQPADVLARLSDAENRIAVERRHYNDMLEHYNAQIQRFPDNIVASVAGFSRDNAYFPTEPRPPEEKHAGPPMDTNEHK